MPKPFNANEYDEEPVIYCAKCYSLKIKHDDSVDSDYCEACGCSDTRTADIFTWENLYERRYGHKFVEKSNDPRKSSIFRLSIEELKKMTYSHLLLDEIIKTLYPRFPGGLVREERVVVLFDRLLRDNRLDDLKHLLLRYS